MSSNPQYPQFITSESPSYERARDTLGHHAPRKSAELVALLSELSEAEQNAADACTRIAHVMSDASRAQQARDQATLHLSRYHAITNLVSEAGGSAPRPDECRDILSHSLAASKDAQSEHQGEQALVILRVELDAAYDRALNDSALDQTHRDAIVGLTPSAAG